MVPLLLAAEARLEGEVHADAEHAHRQDRETRAPLCDDFRHVVELLLQDRPVVALLCLVHLFLHRARIGRSSDGDYDRLTLALLNERAGEDDRGVDHMAGRGELVRPLLLHDRLAGEHLLVDHEVVAPDRVAVARHDIARREQHDVADNNLVARDVVLLAVAEHGHGHVVLLRVQRPELGLLLVIVDAPDEDDDDDGREDRRTLQPPHRVLLDEDADEERHEGREAEEDERRVLQRPPHEGEDGRLGLHRDDVLAELLHAVCLLLVGDPRRLADLESRHEAFWPLLEPVVREDLLLDILRGRVVERQPHHVRHVLAVVLVDARASAGRDPIHPLRELVGEVLRASARDRRKPHAPNRALLRLRDSELPLERGAHFGERVVLLLELLDEGHCLIHVPRAIIRHFGPQRFLLPLTLE
mmetsp:Transcript_11063/g.26858  ORF Transcript_11063/g.26858 Transcript_11063/m.26858 type:complete len:415 (-) Transcript_11063:129-1373(-)